jgi:signal transduction histidine kinase
MKREPRPRTAGLISLSLLLPILVVAGATADGRVLEPLTALLAVGAIASNLGEVRLKGRLWVSGSFLCCLLAAALQGPSAGAFVALVSELGAWWVHRYALVPLLANCLATVAPTWMAGLILVAARPLVGIEGLDFDAALALVACGELSLNALLVASLKSLHDGESFRSQLSSHPQIAPLLGANIVLLVAVSEAYRRVGLAAVVFLVAVMLVFAYMMRLVVEARERASHIEELSAGRGRLVAAAIDAEDRARRDLADRLHDDAIQSLLAARQDIEEAGHGDLRSLDRAQAAIEGTVADLRAAAFELHPAVLDHAGLAQVLQTVVDQHGGRAQLLSHVDVDPDVTGINDHLLFSICRELIANTAKHAEASNLWLTIACGTEVLEITVRDDGRGFSAERQAEALQQGHVGLASLAARVDAVGGTLDLKTSPSLGTSVRIVMPISGIRDLDGKREDATTQASRGA